LDPTTAQEYLEAVATGFCPNCGMPVVQPKRGRPKKFCSDQCRFQWKNRHPKPENWKTTRTAVCPVCGKEYLAFREYTKPRKFCSRTCANRSRAAERNESHQVNHQETTIKTPDNR